MEGTDYWAISPVGMARELAGVMSMQIYLLEEPPGDWQIYMVKRRRTQRENTELRAAFEQGLLEYMDNRRSDGGTEPAGIKGDDIK